MVGIYYSSKPRSRFADTSLKDHQIHFYTLPTLDPIHPQLVKPLRNIITFAVDELHLRRPPPSTSDPRQTSEPVDFCVIKRGAKGYAVVMYSIRERLSLQKVMGQAEAQIHGSPNAHLGLSISTRCNICTQSRPFPLCGRQGELQYG